MSVKTRLPWVSLGAGPMLCVICRFTVELDDIAVVGGTRSCVCLRCYTRETHSELRMPKGLRQDVIATLAGLGVG
jgi:hypothetical protein